MILSSPPVAPLDLPVGALPEGWYERYVIAWQQGDIAALYDIASRIEAIPQVECDIAWAKHCAGHMGEKNPHSEHAPALNFQLGNTFRDLPETPEMVILPTGEFWMGSSDNEEDRYSDEGARHKVRIGQLVAVSKFPVTFDEWDACKADGGMHRHPVDQGWGRGRRPVVNVSWKDAQEYVAWLKKKTDKPYRLLSEAEWEYAARAGNGEHRFPWGDDEDFRQLQQYAWYNTNSGGKTQIVGQKPANAFGLHDLQGNVAEWVEDIYRPDHDAAHGDGRAQIVGNKGDCRVLRGASWLDMARALRSAARDRCVPDHRSYKTGFRIALTL